MFIVSSGKSFTDIDGFACAIAYAELLRLENKEAVAVLVGVLNHSVTKLTLEQSRDYLTEYKPTDEDHFIYVDLSGPEQFAFPNENKIVEIYDHHYGMENYWQERLGVNSHIERVGAAATLIWEEFKKRGLAEKISAGSANLLAIAILQNTLNFSSTETNERDLLAFKELGSHTTLPNNWQKLYFEEISNELEKNFSETLANDTKTFENFFDDEKTFVFSQLEIAENQIKFLEHHKKEIDTYWTNFPNKICLINIPDINSKTSLFYSDNPAWLHEKIQSLFSEVLETSAEWLLVPIHQRKQILKMLNT